MKPVVKRWRTFTLVEILIVVMILGILAAIAIPKMSNASQIARENTAKDDLRLLRTQLGVYKSQHSLFPGYPAGDSASTPTETTAFNQLLQYTDNAGNVSATAGAPYTWGPYMEGMPLNPINNNSDWKILADTDPFTADGTTGWLYQPSSGQIRANIVGNDSAGLPIVEY